VADTEVFLDTSGLLALVRVRDALHAHARRVLETLSDEGTPLVTSQWVLAEFLGGTARPPLRQAALRFVDTLVASPNTTILAATPEGWASALEFYRSRPDKDWSLVDCASMVISQSRGIRRVLTHDSDFEQAGFEALLR
jgi:predicted nucleic acid-binding protein